MTKCWIFAEIEWNESWAPGWGETVHEAWKDVEERATAEPGPEGHVFSEVDAQRVEAFDKYAAEGLVPPYEWILADLGHQCGWCSIMVFPQVEVALISEEGNVYCHNCVSERMHREDFCTAPLYKELKRLRIPWPD